MESDGPKAVAVGAPDMDVLLSRVELLLALAEGVGAPGAIDQRDGSYREAVGRMLHWASTLRAQASADANALVEDAQKEKARVAAEIEVLRAERDLCMALAAEATSAVATQIVKWESLDSSAAVDSSLPNALAQPPAVMEGKALRRADGLEGAEIKEGATRSTGAITLTVSNVPDLSALMRLEEAVVNLPSVATSSVTSYRGGLGSVEITLRYPVSPLMLAAEMVASLSLPLRLDLLVEQQIAARYKPQTL